MPIKLTLPTLLVATSSLSAQGAAPNAALTRQLDAVMSTAVSKGFSGVVRVEKDGRTLLDRGYGMANRASRIPFTPNTVVQIGSNTKDFTAVAILQLQERGRLSVTDPISKYFPGAPADKRNITIWQLVTHRAGFPLGVAGDFEPFSRKAMIDSAMSYHLLFTPGARESYSNTGYSLLAAIIEQLSGKAYDQYVRDNILAPLGLKRTGFLLPNFAARDQAHGYLANGTDYGTMLSKPHAADGPYWNLRGNGGMLSTVGEMHEFYKALFETAILLKPATRALRFDPSAPIGLAGSDRVSFFLYERDPIAHTEIIIASNSAAAQAPAVRREIARVLGLPGDEGRDGAVTLGAPTKSAPAPIDKLIREFFSVLNSGDAPALKAFVIAHFASDPAGPPLDARVQRLLQMRANQGTMTVGRIDASDSGPIAVTINAEKSGTEVVRVMMDRAAPYRIRGMMILASGD